MRGSRPIDIDLLAGFGIIPAHAGLTLVMTCRAKSIRDHPRACGAHSVKRKGDKNERGSSPRMRGSLLRSERRTEQRGIIPAHAGLTGRTSSSGTPSRDHPRACGAHHRMGRGEETPKGSSPRMRGSRTECWHYYSSTGIIPAHAGLTSRQSSLGQAIWDHPRACGAHLSKNRHQTMPLGSSPRMRGSHAVKDDMTEAEGIIPAHAGLTFDAPLRTRKSRDHPRACGAHFHHTS